MQKLKTDLFGRPVMNELNIRRRSGVLRDFGALCVSTYVLTYGRYRQ